MFSLLRPRCAHTLSTPTTRSFTSTPLLSWKSHKNALAETHAALPPYPYGPARWFKQSDKGLYGGSRLQFGNNISERTETKSRRKWHINVKRKALFSKALNRRVRVRVTTRVMRTIDKVGGLDEYLLGEKSTRIKDLGMEGWRLRCLVMGTRTVQKRFNEQRVKLGLPEVDYAALALELAASPPDGLDEESSEGAEFGVEEAQELDEAGVDAAMIGQAELLRGAEEATTSAASLR